MDPDLLGIFMFVLTVVIVITGGILTYPIVRHLGRWLEAKIETERGVGPGAEEIRQLKAAVESLETQVRLLADRQEFTDRLLERGNAPERPRRTPSATPDPRQP